MSKIQGVGIMFKLLTGTAAVVVLLTAVITILVVVEVASCVPKFIPFQLEMHKESE